MPEDSYSVLSAEERDQLVETARMLLAMLEEKDPRLRQHSERVANTSANFCEATGLMADDDLHHLYLAGLLHDVGLIGTPREVTDKTLLSLEEAQLMKKHPVTGVRILSLAGFEPLLAAVRHHHEAWDGSGYPDGRHGEDIPLEARVLRLFDAFDDLTSNTRRPQALPVGEALSAIRERAGAEFDPDLVPRFQKYVESTPGMGEDFMLKKQSDFVKKAFAAILQKFSAGKVQPPAMPQVVFELRSAIQRQEITVKDVAQILERDPVISLRLISVAKSPVYKGYGEVKSVQAAIPRLGFKETLSIVVAIANKSLYEARQPQFKVALDKMWGHSLAAAYAAKLFAQALLRDDSETLFLMGLVHDVGKVILLRAFAESSKEKAIPMEAVWAAVQDSHQVIGNLLLKRWGFGEEFQKVVALHEGGNYSDQTIPDILVVHLANMLTRKMGYSSFDWDGSDLAELSSARLLGLSADTIDRVEGKVKEVVKNVAHLF